jgi:hypothetical protein
MGNAQVVGSGDELPAIPDLESGTEGLEIDGE